MDTENNGLFREVKSAESVRERLGKYLGYWPLFLICIVLTTTIGFLYTRYTVPKYLATNLFLIKGTEGGKLATEDLIQSAIAGTKEVNLNNELLMISSANLLERTIAKDSFNISYFKKGRFVNINVYKEAPFELHAKQLTDSIHSFRFYIKKITAAGGILTTDGFDSKQEKQFAWNSTIQTGGQQFVLSPKLPIKKNDDGGYLASWEPVKETAAQISDALSIKAFDSKTSVVQLSLKTDNLQKGKDILNALFNEFNGSDIDDRNKLSASTISFIDDRLVVISKELTGVEGHVEDYQVNNQLIDIKNQSAQSLENSNDVSKNIKDLAVQQGVASMILDYFNKPVTGNRLVPSSLGLNDATLATLITQYNELQLKKEREAPLVAINSTVMQDLNTQIANVKNSVLESLNNIRLNLQLQEKSLQQQNSATRSYLSSIPHNERVLQEIGRKRTITEGLYLYLLQKREEAAISSTSANVAHYKQIDPASGYGPIEPNAINILIYSFLLGVTLAFAIVYVHLLLNDKVTSKEDVTSKTAIPIIGEIHHSSKRKKQAIPVLAPGLISEQFRTLRTNLSFILKNEPAKVIMITSSVSGDGKSFTSLNLASVCAIPGKKVALLEFDIRNPVINNHLFIDNTKGLTDFITGQVNNIFELFRIVEEIPSLHIYPCGPLPDNPADILISERIPRLLESLKRAYDYIIIDAAPAGLVTDPIILGRYSDLVLYVIRQDKTLKKHLKFVNEITENKTLRNTYLVLNDVKSRDKNTYGKYYNYGQAKKVRSHNQKVVRPGKSNHITLNAVSNSAS